MTSRARLALATILLLALGARLYRLGYKSLWLDEGCTWSYTQKPFRDCIRSEYSNPPGSFAIFWAGARVLGDSEFWLRFPSALSGLLAAWLLFRLARRLFDERTALWATLFFALSAFNLRFSQEARTYGFLTCAVLGSVEATVLLLERPTWARAAAYVVASAAGLHFHYVFGFVIIAHNALFAWVWWRRSGRVAQLFRWAGVQAATGLLFLPWFVTLLRHLDMPSTSYIHYPWGQVLAMFFSFVWGFPRLPVGPLGDVLAAVRDEWYLVAIFFLIFVPLVLRGTVAAARSWEAGPVLLTTVFVPIAIALALATAGSVKFTTDRYLGFVCPFWMMLLAAGIEGIRGAGPRWVARGVVLACMASALLYYYRVPEICNENWRDAAVYVKGLRGPGEPVCIYMPYIHIVYGYYDRDAEVIELPNGAAAMKEFLPRLAKEVRGRRRVWLVQGHHRGQEGELYWSNALRKWFIPTQDPRRFPSPWGDAEVWELVPRR